jgi:hypothetical protein
VWRLVTDTRLNVSLQELGEYWSLVDMVEAHQALDLRDAVEAAAVDKATEQAKRKANARTA